MEYTFERYNQGSKQGRIWRGDRKVATNVESYEGEKLVKAVNSASVGQAWGLIGSAPKGKRLLVAYKNALGNWRVVVGKHFEEGSMVDENGEPSDDFGWFEVSENAEEIPNAWPIAPTHWMPLPQPPQEIK